MLSLGGIPMGLCLRLNALDDRCDLRLVRAFSLPSSVPLALSKRYWFVEIWNRVTPNTAVSARGEDLSTALDLAVQSAESQGWHRPETVA